MNIHISEHWQRFIQDEIQHGRSASAEQMIDEALHLLKEHGQAPAGSTPKADAAARATAMQKPISGMATIRDKMGHWPPVLFRHDGEDWFAFCHLRALSRSEKGQWEAFWNRDFSCN